MIVADTSALITLASINILDLVVEEFDIHTTTTVIQELQQTQEYNDTHGKAAAHALNKQNELTIHQTPNNTVQSSRIDKGEGSCLYLGNEKQADFLITDDLRALPELQTISKTKVAISAIILKALVKRNVLSREDALTKLDTAAERRDWLESPIYHKAKQLF